MKPKEICKHCGVEIIHCFADLWHDTATPLFPQYCKTQYDKSGNILPYKLHAPIKKQNTT